jgi:dihydroorotate dehydrogenase (fumarate)
MEAAGAAAVVLFSLFEEQVELAELGYTEYYAQHPDALPAELQQVAAMEEFKFGAGEYLAHIYQAKKEVTIPIIASLNGYYDSGWAQYAKLLQAAGADALELNIYYLATRPQVSASDVEHMYLDLVKDIKQAISIPVAVKISPYFSAMAHMAHALDATGVDALVLFNRFYQPDFDIENEIVQPSLDLSTPQELRLRLRWAAMLYEQVEADIAITGGVHSAADVVKSVMAGAKVVMLASALFKYGIEHLSTILTDLEAWMADHNHDSLNELRGRMSVHTTGNTASLERANYMRVLKSYE